MGVFNRPVVACALVLAAAASTSAQTPLALPPPPPHPTRVQASMGMLVGGAVGEFGDNVGAAGGLALHVDFGLGRSPVSIGGETGVIWYGSESRDVDLGPAIPELAGVFATVTTDNVMILVHGRVRVQPRTGRWRPYADGLFGFSYIYTKTSIGEGSCSGSYCSPGLEATNLDDYAPSFGVGAGVMIDVGKPGGVRLDLAARYLVGGEADYLTEGGIRREGGQAVLDVRRSGTSMVLAYVGISFGR